MDEKTNLEYILLRNYKELTLITRGILLKMNFDAHEKIDSDTWFIDFKKDPEYERAKRLAKSMIQLEIIAKIMLYIEDLAIISESILRKTNYYSLLDKKPESEEDVGKIVEEFFKNIDLFTDEDICRIMSYGNPKDFNFDQDCVELLKRSTKDDIEEIRRILRIIRDFGKEHHPVFKRYKHAGFPIAPGLRIIDPLPEYVKNFDFISIISVNTHPFQEVKMIPYSKEVLEGYHIIINTLQTLLQDIVENRKVCIQRETSGIPCTAYYSALNFTIEELRKLRDKNKKFDKDHPVINNKFILSITTDNATPNWYSSLHEFLVECKKRHQVVRTFQEKVNKEFGTTS